MMAVPQSFDELSGSRDLMAFSDFISTELHVGSPPPLAQIDFMAIARLMNRVFIIDVGDDPSRRLKFRYTGSSLDFEYGMNLMGRYFEDIYQGTERDLILGTLYQTIDTGKISYLRQHVLLTSSYEKWRLVERIAFPVLDNDQTIQHLVGIVTFMPGSVDAQDIAKLI